MMLRRTAGEDKRSRAGQYETRDLFFHNVDLLWYVMLSYVRPHWRGASAVRKVN